MENKPVYMTLDDKEILRMIHSLEWGEVTVRVKNGKPVMISKREDVKLSD